MERNKERTNKQTNKETDRQADRHAGRQTDRHADRRTDRQADRQTQAGRHIDSLLVNRPGILPQRFFSSFTFACWLSPLHRIFEVVATFRGLFWWRRWRQRIQKSQLPCSRWETRNNLRRNDGLLAARNRQRVHFPAYYRWQIHLCWSTVCYTFIIFMFICCKSYPWNPLLGIRNTSLEPRYAILDNFEDRGWSFESSCQLTFAT